jgi:cephalosporin-C deacetylase-like acetyl esterase
MKLKALPIIALLLLFTAPSACADALLDAYAYDASAPLNPSVRHVSQNRDFTQFHVEYDSANGERVPALLNLPTGGKAPYPCVIAQHGYSSRKEDNLIFALALARLNICMFAIDAQYHGERAQPGKDIFSTDIEDDARALIQTVIDLRRAMDYLQSRPDVKPDRIGYIGVSMGGIIGSLFSGVEKRVQAPILVVGGGGWRTLISYSQIGPAITMRNHLAKTGMDVDAIADTFAAVEPLNFIWRVAPRPVLFINGKRDTLVPPEANRLLHRAAAEPKTIVWFDGIEGEPTGHIPPITDILEICKDWWQKYLL